MERLFFNNKVILSINPENVGNIISGKQTAIIRKGKIHNIRKGDMLFIYETSPTCKLTAYADVEEIQRQWPNTLWDRLKREGNDPCMTREQFAEYTGENKTYNHNPDLYASAIILRNATNLKHHFTLVDLKAQGLNPSQRGVRLIPQQQMGLENLIEEYDARSA